MKRVLLIMAMVLVTVACIAQPTDVAVIYELRDDVPTVIIWDQNTETDADGNPLIDGDVIGPWEVYARPSNYAGDIQDVDQLILLGTAEAQEVELYRGGLARGYYYFGARTYGVNAEGEGRWSPIAWSNNPASVDPTQLSALYVRGPFDPAPPTDYRLQDTGM